MDGHYNVEHPIVGGEQDVARFEMATDLISSPRNGLLSQPPPSYQPAPVASNSSTRALMSRSSSATGSSRS